MIQKVSLSQGSKYGKYFLVNEAPNDDNPNAMKVIKARPRNKARFDFTNDIIEDDDINNDDIPSDDELGIGDLSDEDLQAIELPDDEDEDLDDDEVVGDDDLDAIQLPGMDSEDDQTQIQATDDDSPDGTTIHPIRARARNNARYDFNTGIDEPDDDNIGIENDMDTDDDQAIDLPGDNTTTGDDNAIALPDDTPDGAPDETTTPDDTAAGGDAIQLPGDDAGNNDQPQGADSPDIDETDFTNDDALDTPDDTAGGDNNDQGGGNAIDIGTPPDATTGNDTAGDAGGDAINVGDPPPDLGSDDFTNDAANADGTSNTDNTQQAQPNGPGLEYDSVRKYTLFKEFMRLRTSIDKYIDRLESTISDDPRSNQIIKIATSKFHELYDIITDYLMMKYELCTYVQNLLFYQRITATVQLIFKLLKTTNDVRDRENRKANNTTRNDSKRTTNKNSANRRIKR